MLFWKKIKNQEGKIASASFPPAWLGNSLWTSYRVAPKITSRSWNVVHSSFSKTANDFVPEHAHSQSKVTKYPGI